MADPIDALKKGFAGLRASEELSDCRLLCGPYHFNLHKVVLASQSDYFKTAFKRGTFKEGENGTIELKAIQSNDKESDEAEDDSCDDSRIVKLMVHYFYHFDYSPDALERLRQTTKHTNIMVSDASEKSRATAKFLMTGNSIVPADPPTPSSELAAQENHVIEHAKVFAMAVKYQVDGLRRLAVSKFKDAVEEDEAWIHDNFAQVVSTIFTSTPEDVKDLRDVAEELLYTHFDDLKHKDGIEDVLCSFPRLTYTLLKRKSEKQSPAATPSKNMRRHRW